MEFAMNWQVKKLEREVASWPGVSVHPHRFGGLEFRFGQAEIGHAHMGGVVDIPFPRAMRDALLAEGLAEEHHWVPNSGWTTFRVRREEQMQQAVWLMRLSYARYAIKSASAARGVFEEESRRLALREPFRSLLEQFVRRIPAGHSNLDEKAEFAPTTSRTLTEDGTSERAAE
jgi:Luciferase